MTPELILLLTGALGLGGAGGAWWWLERRAQRAHVIRVRTDWVRAGRIVHVGPVGATCYGTRPRRIYRSGHFGALGLADEQVVFTGHRQNRHDVRIPFDELNWVGIRPIRISAGRTTIERRALILHRDSPSGWYVVACLLDDAPAFIEALEQASGITPAPQSDRREDFGPSRATRLIEDIYGAWHTDRRDALYLAPDRLLFDWRQPVLLADIRRLDVITRGGWSDLNPLGTDLLRIETAGPDGAPQAVGFVVRRARRWAEEIARRTQVPLVVQEGRKKKED
ncbi:MAG: hypothetical protein JW910_10050 [Anaerolineae bacterium]|nr:hypothetical protein [Anaerolineae bacterium]